MTGNDVISKLQSWSVEAATKRSNRPWCLFGLDKPFNQENVAALFNRSELFGKYAERYNETDPIKKKPHSFLQVECHLIYGTHKAFVARHKTRLQAYRDDSAQKAFHVRRTVEKAYARFNALQEKAEGEAVGDE